jgi:thiol:disulfide interchange protein DsbD
MIEFHADWCAACRVLEKGTLVAPEVVSEARRFVVIRVDATDEDAEAARYGVTQLPTIVFVGADGEVRASPRIVGTVGVEGLVGAMRLVR